MAAPSTSSAAFFGRVFWMMVGPLSLALTVYLIVTSGTASRLAAHIAYFVILVGMALGKWAEFRGGNPQTAAGDPATPEDLRRYVVVVLIGGPIVWVIANVVAHHLSA